MARSGFGYMYGRQKVGFIVGIVALTIFFIALFIFGLIGPVIFGFYRIGDVKLEVKGTATKEKVNTGEELSALTYNLGFGAYSQDYTFFLDTGYDDNGNPTCGTFSTARSYDEVVFNTKGAIKVVQEQNTDFIMLQEVDVNSTRSYRVNQDDYAFKTLAGYTHTFCSNFHTAFLPYPLHDMHGEVYAGLSTFSKYKITSAERKSLTIADDFSKFFDLDRCFSVQVAEVINGKKLYIINAHLSAYDEGGKIRAKQMEELDAFLATVKESGDYLIYGGDFNHDLLTYNPAFMDGENYKYTPEHRAFNVTKKDPDWVAHVFDENGQSPFIDGFKIYAADNLPTCRNNDVKWENGKTYVLSIDGFLASDNISVNTVEVIPTNKGKLETDYFAFSDHQPVKITFTLN